MFLLAQKLRPAVVIGRRLPSLLIACALCASPRIALPQAPPPDAGGDPWPREVPAAGATIQIFQPQIDSWSGNQLQAYSAVGVRNIATKATDYGVIWFSARTEVDKVNRLVTLDNFQVTKENFPTLPNNGSAYVQVLTNHVPWTQTIPLDELQASLATTAAASNQKQYPVQNEPPRIIFSQTPAVLALIYGDPKLGPPVNGLERVINSRALIYFDTLNNTYYLGLMDAWVEAPSLTGPWTEAQNYPQAQLNQLAGAAITKNLGQSLGDPTHSLNFAYANGDAPTVYVSTTPAELLLSDGPPNFSLIVGTGLLYVANSGNDIFSTLVNSQYYVLIAGRWFTSPSLQNGPWTYVPATNLPTGFAQIPDYSPKASVLVSIPGTPQAKEALIANSIPQTATITIAATHLSVTYYGAPDFEPVTGTSLLYAVNSASPVVYMPGGNYFAVKDGVWFASPSPNGPWLVTNLVPPVIYTIPTSSPVHYVTYVQVYGSAPGVVYVGYTPGYYGTVVTTDGVVVYGTGYAYPSYATTVVWIPPPATYGSAAGFTWSSGGGWALAFGVGMAVGASCSPYWGPTTYYHWGYAAPAWGYAAYGGVASTNMYGHYGATSYAGTKSAWANPYTGNYGSGKSGSYYNSATGASGNASHANNYNAYTGTSSSATKASGYNPTTGTGYHAASGSASNAYTGNYAAGAHGSTYDASTGVVHGSSSTTTGNAYTGKSSSSSSQSYYNTKTGNGVADVNNNVYADKDGNVYKADPSSTSGYKQSTSSGWSSTDKSTSSASSLNSESAARSQGSSQWSNYHSGSSGTSSDSRGGWGGGGSSRGGGGGGRR
jgi:hypothetical protein